MLPETRKLVQYADRLSKERVAQNARIKRLEDALTQIAGSPTVWPSGETSRHIALDALGVPCKACGEPVTVEHAQVEVVQCGDLNGIYHDVCKPTPDQYRDAAEARDA